MQDSARYAQDTGYRQYLHFFSDNNALVRRSVWEIHPYPDVNFAEDQIWAKHIIEAGFKKAYAHDGSVFHSHDYKLFERLQRSFDESYAFHQLFAYTLCPNLTAALRSAVGITWRNLAYARQQGLWRTQPGAVLRAPFENLMKTLGHYLGSHGATLSPWLREKLSWDHRLHTGLRTAQAQTSQP
jgi:rhamnosyltransferase